MNLAPGEIVFFEFRSFRHSDLFRISDFVLRIYNTPYH